MSYSFVVEAAGGTLSVRNQSEGIPDGAYMVAGHEEPAWLSISVTRQDSAGVQVAQASSYGKRA